MVNVTLVETILREQDDPGSSTTRQIRELYNNRSGEDPIVPHTEIDKEFKSILLKALEIYAAADEDEKPISYTVKLKDEDENTTPVMKRRSIIKLPKEERSQSESDEPSSDSERILQTNSSISANKPFSPLFLNNMKKFGVSTDWLAKRSNSARHSSYSRSSIKSNTSQLDAMIKSASAKPVKSSRKLSFVESNNSKGEKLEFDKENIDPSQDNDEPKEEVQERTKTSSEPTPYDLCSESEEEQNEHSPSPSKDFSLRIQRVDMVKGKKKRMPSSSSSASDEEKSSKPKKLGKPRRKSKKEAPNNNKDEQETTGALANDDEKKTSQKKSKADRAKGRIEHLKKLLRTAGIRTIIRNAELDEFSTEKAKINYLESLFEKAGFTGNFTLKDCEKFRQKRAEEKELEEIQANSVSVKGHVKGGRTLRGRARSSDNEYEPPTVKRKRKASEEVEENDNSNDEDEPQVKKRRILKMEASPEVSENDME